MPRVMLTYQTGSAFNRSCFIQPPPTPPLPAEPYASAFALAYSLRLRSCRLMGAFVISPRACLPSCRRNYKQQGPFAPRALPCFLATTNPTVTLSSSTDFPGSPVIRPTLLPPISRRDEEGFSSCATRPVSPCCHFHPAGVTNRLSQVTVRHAVFASRLQARPPSVRTFGATSVIAVGIPIAGDPPHRSPHAR